MIPNEQFGRTPKKRLLITAMLSIAAAGAEFAADLEQPMPDLGSADVHPNCCSGVQSGANLCRHKRRIGLGTMQMDRGDGWPFTRAYGFNQRHRWLGRGSVGANFQTDAFVFGVEGDWDYSAINTGTTGAVCGTFGTCQTGNNWLATARARVGYAADRVLFFGTAGGAFANMQTTYSGVQSSTTKAGWTAGAGVEWAFADNWTAKVEYLYIDLGTFNGNCSTAACVGVTGAPVLPVSASLTENFIRAGVNFG